MRRSYLLWLFVFSPHFVGLIGCTGAPDFWEEAKAGQKKILVSFPPLYCITHAVAGDDGYVLCLLTSQGPHDYDGAPTDALKVAGADLVISNGLGLDDMFVEKMLSSSRNTLHTLNVGRVLEESNPDKLNPDQGHLHEDGKIHKHGAHDPHIWLGPEQAIAMTKIIADKLAVIDSAHKQGYAERAERFIKELKNLEEHGKTAFKEKKHKNIVTMHESLNYFVKPFGLTVAGTIQAKPGADPDGASMANLVQICLDKDVKVFAVEPQYSKAQAQTLQNTLKQKKLNVEIVQIDPLETAPIPHGKRFNPDPGYYLAKMRENIDTLAKALP